MLIYFLGLIVVAGVALWAFGPREPASLEVQFDAETFNGDVDAYFAQAEAQVPDITPGTEKRVIWDGEPGTRRPLALVYIHGFSATSEEIRPVPDKLAKALGANLVYTRLTGHGRGAEAMAEPQVADWMRDTAEAIRAAEAVGDQVVIVATSTGGTLVTAAAFQPDLMRRVKALIFVSPNFGVNSPVAGLMTWPAARHWLPRIAGIRRSFEPINEAQATYWTPEYPSVALLPMAALVRAVSKLDVSKLTIPAFFWYAPDDQVVRGDLTASVIARWGGPVTSVTPQLTDQDDSFAHVTTGDIVSPNQTEPAVAAMLSWLRGL